MTNHFSKKAEKLSDQDLLYRVENSNSFVLEALEAVIEEIKKRNIKVEDSKKLLAIQKKNVEQKALDLNNEVKNEQTTEKFKNLDDSHFANFGVRILAAFLDLIIGFFIMMIGGFFLNIFISILTTKQKIIFTNIYFIVFWFLYFVVFESSVFQATIGKKVVGIKVVDNNGLQISFSDAIIRFLGKLCSILTLTIGFFLMIGNSKNQTLHDKFAKTFIIKDK